MLIIQNCNFLNYYLRGVTDISLFSFPLVKTVIIGTIS